MKMEALKREVIVALGAIGGAKSLELIHHHLEGDSALDQLNAAEALIRRGDKIPIEILIKIMIENLFEKQRRAAILLGEIGDKKAAEPVLNYLFERYKTPACPDNHLFAAIKNLFEDYTDLIRDLLCCVEMRREEGGSEGMGHEGIYYFYKYEDHLAVNKLCKIKTAVSTNLLHKILDREDIEVLSSHEDDYIHSGVNPSEWTMS